MMTPLSSERFGVVVPDWEQGLVTVSFYFLSFLSFLKGVPYF